jgi:uncharacterized LabA/DUF88 family protein
MADDRLKIAVFIDFDNVEIGVKTTLGRSFDIGAVLEAVKERGEIITKVAYGDWKRADYGRAMSNHAVRLVQRVMTPGGDKNGADINLALDALEMAFTHDHINAFVIVGGDSDFITLVEKLKQYDRKVFVVGGRQFTSQVMQKNCTEFIAYENIAGSRGSAPRGGGDRAPQPIAAGQAMPIDQVVPLVRRALKVLLDREVTPQLGLLKSTLLQLDSSFSERDYGASTFRDFAEKLAERNVVVLKHTGRSTQVELAEGAASFPDVAPSTDALAMPPMEAGPAPLEGMPAPPPREFRDGPREPREAREPREPREPRPQRELDPATQQAIAEGVEMVRQLITDPPQPPRWPMYLRQIKQFIRLEHPDFDERKYGSIVELMRACQKEGLVKLERDRQGGLRVFAGSAAPASAPPPVLASPERVYVPKSVTLGWVIGDDDEETGEGPSPQEQDVPVVNGEVAGEAVEGAEAGAEAQGDEPSTPTFTFAPVEDDLEPGDEQSAFFGPEGVPDTPVAPPAKRGGRRPRRSPDAGEAAPARRTRKTPTAGARKAPVKRRKV